MLLCRKLMQWGLEGNAAVESAQHSSRGPQSTASTTCSGLQLPATSTTARPSVSGSLGTGVYILTHKYIHLKITKNER